MAPPILFLKRIYAECSSGETTKSSFSPLREPAFFKSDGTPINKTRFFDQLESRLKVKSKNVIFLGENHLDPGSHLLELEILKKIQDLKPGESALSLEFYDRSAQYLLDEYLMDFIDYETFIEEIDHPPPNHKDYRPLIDFCKRNKLSVIAANCSEQHIRVMSDEGPKGLEKLAEDSELHSQEQINLSNRDFLLPPLPIQRPSLQYEENFRDIMGYFYTEIQIQSKRLERMLNAQSLWDATMAYSVTKELHRSNLVIHVAGHFHVKANLGIPEHLSHYCKNSIDYGQTTIIMLPEDDLIFCDDDHKNAGDFIVLTDINAIDI